LRKILIIGCSGAGKSTLARQVGRITDLPVIHLDQHYWPPGWQEPDRATWRCKVSALIAQPRWVMDGNYRRTLALRLAEADTVIFLDFPTWLCLVRVLRRVGGSVPSGALGSTWRQVVLSVWTSCSPNMCTAIAATIEAAILKQ
jgi:adenylate kinase family enzyme